MLIYNPGLVVFTRLPEKGRVKTRLVPPLSAGEALELHKSLLLDTLSLVRGIEEYSLIMAYSPPRRGRLLEGIGGFAALIPQEGNSLGERMRNAFKNAFDMGYSPVILIGTDFPTLPVEYLSEALVVLKREDVVLGPSIDGGYYLIGMHELYEEVFEGIPWGSEDVLRQTLEKLIDRNLSFECLGEWYDVDTWEDLLLLREHIKALKKGGLPYPERTYDFLRGLRL